MTLSRIVRFMVFVLTVVAAVPLYLSGEMPGIFWAASIAGLSMGVMVGSKVFSRQKEVVLRILVMGTLVVLLLTGFQADDRLLNSINFVFLVTITRGMRLRTSRHFFQLIGLSFLILSVSSIINLDIAFAFSFLVYTIFLTWTLVYTHITQQVESSAHPDAVAPKASKFVTGKFLLGSSALGLGLLIFSLAVFVLFPRVSLGYFTPAKKGETVQGFSDTIDLGHFGTIEASEKIILRLEFLSGKDNINPETTLYLRGMSFDRYDGRGWSKSNNKKSSLRRFSSDDYFSVHDRYYSDRGSQRILEYNIYQEPLHNETPVIFSIPTLSEIKPQYNRVTHRQKRVKFFIDRMGDITHNQEGYESLDYTVRSRLMNSALVNQNPTSPRYDRSMALLYTQIPTGLDRRISQFARELSKESDTSYDSAFAIEQALKWNYSYTREGTGFSVDPVANFLFERKEGHCEYFATAMVVMLRSLGIPARPVNGFLGSQYNSYGDYYIVTEANAHSWVEVFFPKRGWVTFDPTPPVVAEKLVSASFTEMNLFLDSMKLQWYKWVVFYNLDRQILLYTGLWNVLLPDSQNIDLGTHVSAREFRMKVGSTVRNMKNWKIAVLMFGLISFVPGARFLSRVYGQRKQRRASYLGNMSLRLKKLLNRKGCPVTPGLTLPALSRQSKQVQFSAQSELGQLVALIEKGRWDPSETVHEEKIKSLYKAVSRSSAGRQ